MRKMIVAAALTVGLAGCGGDEGAAGGSAPAAASGWDATQACAMLDVGKLSALTGMAFETAKLTPMSPMTDSTAATSMCEYAGPGGAMANVLTREAPYDDAGPEDVPGLGKAALWRAAPMAKTLQVFYDERRSVVVTLAGREATLEQASAVARAVAP